MKIFVLFFALIINLSFLNIDNICCSKSETITYAKALSFCNLYKNDSMNENEIIFIVPESYFVMIIEIVNDECFRVQYKKYVGYVKSKNVTICEFVPIVKYLNGITLDIKQSSGTQIWSSPSVSSSILATVSAGVKDIEYIAYTYGDIPSGGNCNLWYYILYTPAENATNVYEGYVYSENTTNLTEITLNLESNPEVISDENSGDDLFVVSSSVKTIVVTIIAIPIILFILIILYKFAKKFIKTTNKENFENNKTINTYNSNNYPSDNNLKLELDKLKNEEFIKKQKTDCGGANQYPPFPSYSSEDDWLWFWP